MNKSDNLSVKHNLAFKKFGDFDLSKLQIFIACSMDV